MRAHRLVLGVVLVALVLGWASPEPAVAGPPPVDDDVEGTFHWDDPAYQNAFSACLDNVAVVAGGDARMHSEPAGFDRELWRRAVDRPWFFLQFRIQTFTYQPHCDVLLPQDWLGRVPPRFKSETFSRCQANVSSGQRTHRRPDVVPAWYWETSMRTGQCWLLLARGAFEVGDDANAWSGWTSTDEVIYPETSDNPAVSEALNRCGTYIEWRMNGAATFPGLGSLYQDPPPGSVPDRVWHEALNYYRDPVGQRMSDRTVPNDWRPNCGLLLLSHPCDPLSSKGIVPELCVGPHATSQYDIGYSEYDALDEAGDATLSRVLWGASTSFAYFIGKSSVHVSLWLVDWGYSFNIAQLNPLADHIGDSYQNNIVNDPVGQRMQDLFWLILISWAGINALRGKLAMAGGELLTTVVLLLFAAVLIENRTYYMDRTWDVMTESSNTLLSAGLRDGPGVEGVDSTGSEAGTADGAVTDRDLIRGVQARIHRVFVEDAYDHLNWGRTLGDASDPDNPLRACVAARYYILDQGPHAAAKFPRESMRSAGEACHELANYNRNPTGTRLMGAILTMVSSVAVAILLGLMALTIIVGKFIALLLFAVAPLAVMVIALPGPGRKVAWSWGATLIQVLLGVIGMSFLLSLLLLALMGVSSLTEDVPLIERFLLMNLIVFVMFAARRALLASGQRLAGRLGEYMSAVRGSGTTWAGAGAASAGQGINMLRIDRSALWTVGAPASVVGGHLAKRITERRVAKRGYRNLKNIAYWKRHENAGHTRWRNARKVDALHAPERHQPLP